MTLVSVYWKYIGNFLLLSKILEDEIIICNFCGFTDETPREYHCSLGPDVRRRDADEMSELCRGTVEFVATREYMVSFFLLKGIHG